MSSLTHTANTPLGTNAKRVLWAAGLLYSAIVLICAAHHEAWFDEAQSWLLARDASLPDLLIRYARWEGSPSLWQLLLMPFAKSGFPYVDLSFISAALGILGVTLFLWRAPFPLWMRLLFPFTYFPLFQYSVVARSYALMLPVLCVVAILFRSRVSTRPIVYCVLLAILANTSFHGTIVAGVLFAEWLWAAWKNGMLRSRPALVASLTAAFGILYLLLYLELRIPLNLSYTVKAAHPLNNPGAIRFLKQISEAFWGGLGSNIYRGFSTLVGLFVIGFSLLRFGRSAPGFILSAGTLLLLTLAGLKHAASWHAGVIFLLWILALWIFFEQRPEAAARSTSLLVVIAVILIAQVVFGVQSVWFDIFRTYSGSRDAAAYLAATGEDSRKLYPVGFKAYGIEPYFHRNVFAQVQDGRREAFYLWRFYSGQPNFDGIVQQKPDEIVLSPWLPETAARLKQLGYCEEKHFEGAIWWKNAIAEPDTYSLLIPCRGPRS